MHHFTFFLTILYKYFVNTFYLTTLCKDHFAVRVWRSFLSYLFYPHFIKCQFIVITIGRCCHSYCYFIHWLLGVPQWRVKFSGVRLGKILSLAGLGRFRCRRVTCYCYRCLHGCRYPFNCCCRCILFSFIVVGVFVVYPLLLSVPISIVKHRSDVFFFSRPPSATGS